MCSRVDVAEELDPVEIPPQVLNELFAHAREALPEECCGLILGNERERFRRVRRCHNDMTRLHQQDPLVYPRDGRSAFFMRPSDYQQVIEEATQERERVTAVYHSHVDAGAYLSEMDLSYAEQELFPFPSADHIVVGVDGGGAVREAALFRRTFVGRRIKSSAP